MFLLLFYISYEQKHITALVFVDDTDLHVKGYTKSEARINLQGSALSCSGILRDTGGTPIL